jgi:hypothetical protein
MACPEGTTFTTQWRSQGRPSASEPPPAASGTDYEKCLWHRLSAPIIGSSGTDHRVEIELGSCSGWWILVNLVSFWTLVTSFWEAAALLLSLSP